MNDLHARYASLAETIEMMGRWGPDHPFGIDRAVADRAVASLPDLEGKMVPPPLLLPEGDGLCFVWNLSDWKLYRFFDDDGSQWDHFICGKDARIVDYRGTAGGGSLPILPLPPMPLSNEPVL